MKPFHFYFLFSLLGWLASIPALQAQEVQWAATVLDFSSQYGSKDYAAKQILGVPNAIGGLNLHDMAWVPKRDNSPTGEFIHVGFSQPMQIRQVAIAESLNPGAIHRIYLYGPDGKKQLIYENKSPRPVFAPFRMFRHKFPLTKYDVMSLRVELRSKAIEGSNQLDAIGISSSSTPIEVKVNTLQYGEEVAQAERLSPAVNSEYAERLPMISPDGKTLYFARKYHPQNIGEENNDDIWVAYRQPDGRWSNAVNIGAPLNNKDHNFVAAFNPTGDVLYLGSDYRQRSKDGVSVSFKRGRSWSTPKPLQIENHYNESDFVCYHMSLDEQVLLMSVERTDGLGGLDLYAAFRQSNNTFSEPMNLGSQINTVGAESSIFLAADGKTIYFSSNGHEGYGGYDMFMSRRLDDSWQNWTPPKNLGSKINSSKNEYNYTIPASGDYAYFSSGDVSSKSSNLYRIPLPEEVQPEPVMLVTGRLINAETQKPLQADLKFNPLQNADDKKPASIRSDGSYQLVLPYGEDIEVYAETAGYFAISENLPLSGRELEGLDYDQEGMLAQSDGEDTVIASNGDIERLQLRLSELDEDMKALTQERQRVKEEYQQRESIQKTEYRDDPELEALRHKYNNTMRSKKETDQKQYGRNEESTEVASTGDRELDELRKKFNRHYNGDAEEGNGSSSTPSSPKPKNSKELKDMRAKYERHYGEKEPQKEKPPVKSTPTKTIENPDFELLEIAVRQQLQDELFADEYKTLRRSLLNKELRTINRDLTIDEQKQLKEPGYVSRLKRQITSAPVPALVPQSYPLLEEKAYRTIVADLRRTLEDEARSDLKKKLAPQIQDEIRNTLTYEIKKTTEQRVRKELEEKMQAQIQAEKARHEAVVNQPSAPKVETEEEAPLKIEYQEVEKDILLLPIKVGQVIPMNNLFFDSNQATLKDASTSELERVLKFLKDNPKLVVEIGGHTNGWCSHVFANELSWKRSEAVLHYFSERGIPKSRLQHRGYGKTKPIASNDSKIGRKKNQRVEMKILEILN